MEDRLPHAPASFKYPSAEEWGKETPEWIPDELGTQCFLCGVAFSTFRRRHHCRICGGIFCRSCCPKKRSDADQRCCTFCFERAQTAQKLRHSRLDVADSPIHADSKQTDKYEQNQPQQEAFPTQDTEVTCLLNVLDISIVRRILLFLPYKDLMSISLASTTFYQLVEDNTLWMLKYEQQYFIQHAALTQADIPWKLIYKQKYLLEREALTAPTSRDRSSRRCIDFMEKYNELKPMDLKTAITTTGAKVVILGSSGVGKSCMISHLCEKKFNTQSTPSSGAKYFSRHIFYNDKTMKLQIWDTAGMKKFWTITPLYYRDAHAVVLVYSIDSRRSFTVAKKWCEEIKAKGPPGILLAIVGSKRDINPSNPLHEEMAEFITQYQIPIFTELSAKTGENIEILFEQICFQLEQKASNSLRKTTTTANKRTPTVQYS